MRSNQIRLNRKRQTPACRNSRRARRGRHFRRVGIGLIAAAILGASAFAQVAAPVTKRHEAAAPIAGDPKLLKDVMIIAFKSPPNGTDAPSSAVIALPGKKVDGPPEALLFYAAGLHPERLPTFAVLTRAGGERCRDTDFDLSSLRSKGLVRIRSRESNNAPIHEELYVATENIGKEPGFSRIYFKLAKVEALDSGIACANF